MSNDVRSLAALLTPAKVKTPEQFGRVWGVVTQIVTGPPRTVTVTLNGGATSATGIRYLHSYLPTIGDTVVLLATGPDLLCLGNLA